MYRKFSHALHIFQQFFFLACFKPGLKVPFKGFLWQKNNNNNNTEEISTTLYFAVGQGNNWILNVKYIYILSHLIQKYDYEFNILSDSSWLRENMNQLPHNRTGNPKTLTPDPRTIVVLDQDIVTFRRLSTGNPSSLSSFSASPQAQRGGWTGLRIGEYFSPDCAFKAKF